MNLLQRLGLAPKPARPAARRVGLKLRKERPSSTALHLTRREKWTSFGALAGLVLLTLLAFPSTERFEYNVRPGDVWQREEVVAPFQFSIFKTEQELRAQRDSIRFEEPPIFSEIPDADLRTTAAADSLADQLETVLQSFAEWQGARVRGQRAEAARDSTRFRQLQALFEPTLTPRQWDDLALSYAARTPGLPAPNRADAGGPDLATRVVGDVRDLALRLLPRGVLDVSRDSIMADAITVRNERDFIEQVVQLDEVLGFDDALNIARNELAARYAGREDTVDLAVALFQRVLDPSLKYRAAETEAVLAERQEQISPTRGVVQKGQSIIRRGDRVTPEIAAQLASLTYIRSEQRGGVGPWRTALGQLMLTIGAYAIFFLYLYLLRPQLFGEQRYLILVCLLFAAIVGFFAIAVRIPAQADLAVPVALASILLAVIFDSRVGMFGTFTLAMVGGFIFGLDFEFAFATMFAGVMAVLSVRDIKNRSQLLITAGIVFTAYLLVIGAYTLLRSSDGSRFVYEVILVACNAGLLLLAYPLLWAFERAFGVATDLTLLELSDTNRPLLKELSLRAPGTFNHSLQVANLAEAAADAVGANALQARIGALYHDIGKMLKPEYYIENQQAGENPHDRVTPYMSALIIASHVKDGVELGQKEGKLPQVVLDFIPSHHGTTLMEFFYRRAKELAGPEDPSVDEAEFRYPGPRPQTNEQAIVMLADSVEAASRSLQKPTPKRLENLVEAIFRARIEDGQLDDVALTFQDLRKIRETFLAILAGIYHFRVKYPGQDEITGEESTPSANTRPPTRPVAQEDDTDSAPSLSTRPPEGMTFEPRRSRDPDASDLPTTE